MRRIFSFGNAVGRKVTALAVALVVVGSAAFAQAASVSSISILGPDEFGFYQKPGNLVGGSLDQLYGPDVDDDPVGLGQSIRGYRNNTQTFTVDAGEYGPGGVDVAGFVINFRNRSADNDYDFGVRLFRVDQTELANNNVVVPETVLVLNPDSLMFPTGTAYGTATFHFDSTVSLTPGLYAFQFLLFGRNPNNHSNNDNSVNNLFWWAAASTSTSTYAGGTYAISATTAAPGGNIVPGVFDVQFGLIQVPEPGSWILLSSGVLAVAALRRRITK